VVIRHGYGYETLYAHLSKYNWGWTELSWGDIIGYVGSREGRSTLHYEVHKQRVVNLNFLLRKYFRSGICRHSKLANQKISLGLIYN
jgi:murein DD-endopeptidase MepM/ murein hydrolase activator NlpD